MKNVNAPGLPEGQKRECIYRLYGVPEKQIPDFRKINYASYLISVSSVEGL